MLILGEDISKAIVRIGGLEYTIKGNEPEEYLHKVAIYVDKKMKAIEKTNFNLSTSMLAVLTSINLADEVLKSKEELEKLHEELDTLKEEAEILNDMLMKLEEENKILRDTLERYDSRQNTPKKQIDSIIYDVTRSNKSKR